MVLRRAGDAECCACTQIRGRGRWSRARAYSRSGKRTRSIGLQQARVLEPAAWRRRRYTIVALCFLAFMLCTIDRTSLSITILPMSRDFGWSEGQQGLIQAAFFVGYAFPQLPGGVLADRFGGKQVLGSGVLFWSLSTAFTPLSARHTLNSLLLCRALMGVGEGVAMPAMNSLIARHVPPSERSRALSTVYSGFFLGSAAGLGVSPFLVSLAGWPSVFYIFGASGIVWWFFWATQATNGPEEDSKITEAERARISLEQTGSPVHKGDSSRAQQKTQIPWKSFLRSQAVWSIIISHFSNSWGSFIILTWLPTYLKSFNLSLEDTGALALLPWVTMSLATNAAGWTADLALSQGAQLTRVRKVAQTVGFLGPCALLSILPKMSSARGAVLTLILSQACSACSHSGFYAQHGEIAPEYSGILLALSNSAGIVAGTVGTAFVGWWLEQPNGDWETVWLIASALFAIGAAVHLRWSTSQRQNFS